MRSKKKYSPRFFAALALAVGAIGLTGLPAQAQTPVCPSGATCLWEDTNYLTNGSSTSRVIFYQWIGNFGLWNYSGTSINGANSASSVYNNGNVDWVYLYNGTNKAGNVLSFATKVGTPDLGPWIVGGVSFNNNLESGYFASWN